MFKSVYFLQALFSAFLILIILGLVSLFVGKSPDELDLFNNLANFIIIK